MKQPDETNPDCWAFFDKIYCISIDQRSDRRRQAEKQFADVGLLDRVEFVIVPRHPENREKGIFQSHMHCLQKGLTEGAGNILIFEDDVFFQHFDARVLSDACSSLGNPFPWNAFFLGCLTRGSRRTGQQALVKIKYRCLAHGYALNRPFAERIVREKWNNIPFDNLLQQYESDFYALYPMCAFQGRSGTDNQTVAIDLVRRLCGGLPFIQRTNELYQNHRMPLLAVQLTILLLLGALVLKLWP